MTNDPLDAMKARWNHIQGTLFPWLREEVDPMTEALGRLVTTLDVIGLEAFVAGPPRGRGADRALARRAHRRGDRTQRMQEFDAVETRHVEIEHQNVGKPARQNLRPTRDRPHQGRRPRIRRQFLALIWPSPGLRRGRLQPVRFGAGADEFDPKTIRIEVVNGPDPKYVRRLEERLRELN